MSTLILERPKGSASFFWSCDILSQLLTFSCHCPCACHPNLLKTNAPGHVLPEAPGEALSCCLLLSPLRSSAGQASKCCPSMCWYISTKHQESKLCSQVTAMAKQEAYMTQVSISPRLFIRGVRCPLGKSAYLEAHTLSKLVLWFLPLTLTQAGGGGPG